MCLERGDPLYFVEKPDKGLDSDTTSQQRQEIIQRSQFGLP